MNLASLLGMGHEWKLLGSIVMPSAPRRQFLTHSDKAPTMHQGTSSDFEELLLPLGLTTFVTTHLGRSFAHLRGSAGRFHALFSWDALSDTLSAPAFDTSRLKLFRGGQPVPREHFLDDIRGIKQASMVNLLADGATLIVDNLQNDAFSLRSLTDSAQSTLSARAWVNLYAAWKSVSGFDVHWDDHDTFILQLGGRKHWSVFEPTRLHPLKADPHEPRRPSAPPVWEGVLDDGDVLYLPRGWWHAVRPIGEPSMHVTLGILAPTGTDFMRWLLSRLLQDVEFRQPIPVLQGTSERAAHALALKQCLARALDPGEMEHFLDAWRASLAPIPRIRFPQAPLLAGCAITLDSCVRLVEHGRLGLAEEPGDRVHFLANGSRWVCSAPLRPALERLTSAASLSVSQLCDSLHDEASRAELLMFLSVLAMGGVIWAEPAGLG